MSAASIRTTDLAAIHALLDEAFSEDRSHHPAPFDRWVEEETNTPNHDPALWLLARDGETPVGVLAASTAEDRGWVDYLAVAASHRGRGIGAALLYRSFGMFAERDIRRVLVSVDARNPTGATGVYERAGCGSSMPGTSGSGREAGHASDGRVRTEHV